MAGRSTASSASRRAALGLAAALVGAPTFAHGAGSQASQACARAAEEGQALRDDGKLFRAREAFAACIRPSCPKVIAKQCDAWLEDVTSRTPSLVVVVESAEGRDLPEARIFVDDAPREDLAQGRAISLDPGPHTVRAEAGALRLEERVVLRERERDRRVVLRPPRPVAVTAPPPKLVAERPVPVVTYALTGVSVVLGAVGAGFGVSAANTYADLERRCPNDCTDSDLLGLRAKTVTADLAFSLAIAAAVGAVVLYVTRPTLYRQSGLASSLSLRF